MVCGSFGMLSSFQSWLHWGASLVGYSVSLERHYDVCGWSFALRDNGRASQLVGPSTSWESQESLESLTSI